MSFSPADADAGRFGQQVALVEGANTITIDVVAQDGKTTKQYTLIITRLSSLSTDATLKTLSVSGGGATLLPAFAATTLAYTAQVGSSIGVVTVVAEANAAEASVAITPADADTRTAGHQIQLAEGANTITVEVTARDGKTKKTYTLTVTRGLPLSQDATLKTLSVSGGGATLLPAFAATTLAYTAQVGSSIGVVTVVAEANAAEASVAITPADADTRTAGHQVPLYFYGGNKVTITVTAEDGTTKSYVLTVYRLAPKGESKPPSSDATLRALALSSGSISPAFAATTYQYTAQVDNSVAILTVVPIPSTGAQAAITPADADPTVVLHQVALNEGANSIIITVTASDGTTKTYTLTITRTTKTGATGLQFVGEVADQHYTAGTAITPLVVPEAVGGQGEVAYRMVGLPGGLSFAAATRTISGTPTTATGGAIEVACFAEDSAGTIVILSFAITVNPPLNFGDLFGAGKVVPTDSHDLAKIREFVVGQRVEGLTLPEGTGGTEPLTYSLSPALPAGLTFDAITRTIAGTPRAASEAVYTYTVTDANGVTASMLLQTLPAAFSLADNFPNPFNPTTTIQYALPQAADVELTVYNVVGQPVRTLIAEHQSAGRYVVEWDATNDSGHSLSSGMYFYRLQAGGEFFKAKKMLLLR